MGDAPVIDLHKLAWIIAHNVAQDEVKYLTERARHNRDPGDAFADYLKAWILTWLDRSFILPNTREGRLAFNW
jgi:hypothetical protein